jgi:hypothetical protein
MDADGSNVVQLTSDYDIILWESESLKNFKVFYHLEVSDMLRGGRFTSLPVKRNRQEHNL